MLIKETKNMTDSERMAVQNSNNQFLQSLAYVAVGTIFPYAGSTPPETFMFCDGSELDTVEYEELFSIIGYNYGGSGEIFKLPDLRGRTLVGVDEKSRNFKVLGQIGGQEEVTLKIENLPSHDHQTSSRSSDFHYGNNWNPDVNGSNYFSAASNPTHDFVPRTSSTGGDKAHNNLQPYFVCNFIIKTTKGTCVAPDDHKNSIAVGQHSHAEGVSTVSGQKAFTVTAVDKGASTYTLDSVEGLAVGDIYSAHIYYSDGSSTQGEDYGKITAIDEAGNTVTVDKLFCDKTFAVKDSYLDEDGLDTEQNTFRINAKPLVGTRSIGFGAHAEGKNTKALSKAAHTEGMNTVAYGSYSHAEGNDTKAGFCGHSEGLSTKATGRISHAEGQSTESIGEASHSEGLGAKACGPISHAEGNNTKAEGQSAHAEGRETVAQAPYSHTEGLNTKATGQISHAEGQSSEANGDTSHAEGFCTKADGTHSHAEGESASALGYISHAEGQSTEASGQSSHAEGLHTKALNLGAHSEGWATKAHGEASHAEGFDTKSNGKYSHAEGYSTTARGVYSHAEGGWNEAGGQYSHTEGYNTKAQGDFSHAGGENCIASARAQTAIGRNNAVNDDALFIVGNGKDNTARSNAFEVLPDGSITVGGVTLTPTQLQKLLDLIS